MPTEPARTDDDTATRRLAPQSPFSPRALRLSAPDRYAVALAATILALLIQLWLNPQPRIAPFVFFFAAVAIASWLGGWGPGLLSVALSAALANYAFVEPAWRGPDSRPAFAATALFIVAGSIVALLCSSFRQSLFRIERAAQALRAQALIQEKADAALRESEARARARATELQAVLDLVPAAVWIARDPEASRIDANRFGAELLERPRGANVSVTAPPDERPTNFRPMRNGVEIPPDELPIQTAARRGVGVYGSEFDLVFDGGRVRHLLGNSAPLHDEHGRVTGSVGAFIDITERKLAEEALTQSEARFRNLANALPQMVFDVDASGVNGYYNAQWLRYTGRTPDDSGMVSLVHPDDRASVAARWAESMRTGSTYECEYRFLRHDGQYRWVLARALPVRDPEGRVARWFGTATDIHELKQTETTLRNAARRRDEFLAILSHELRNPLAPITNCLHVLEHAAPGGDQARRALDVISRQTAQLSNLVNQLLDATRLSRSRIQLRRERLDLSQVVSRAVEDHRSLFERAGVRLDFDRAEDPVAVDGDATRLGQVIGNFLQNAAKFTNPGGYAQVRVGLEREEATVRVRDDGLGIAPEMLGQLFQPFMQAAQSLGRSKGGLGLGLALAKDLVELHGGTVSVRSDGLGTGTEFVVRLPIAAGANPVPPPRLSPAATMPRRILIIEDNADAATSLCELLKLWGHMVTVARGGEEGLECVRTFRPDLVLCDIGLPGMDGYAVARSIRADPNVGDVRLVALSGYALPEDLDRAAEAGFDAHLAKPAEPEKLAALLSS